MTRRLKKSSLRVAIDAAVEDYIGFVLQLVHRLISLAHALDESARLGTVAMQHAHDAPATAARDLCSEKIFPFWIELPNESDEIVGVCRSETD